MRQDRVIFNGENPFNEFAKCKELTVLLTENSFVFVATMNSISMMATFNSKIKEFKEDGEEIRTSYTIPLSLILPLFKLDTQTQDNVIVLETTVNKVTITYNDVSVTTDIFSPNGLTINQINEINTDNSLEVDPTPFIRMTEVFGTTKDNFCNVMGNTLFIADQSKCLINTTDFDYGRDFSISVQFIRLMKTMGCTKLYIGDNVVAKTKSGIWIVTNLSKVTDTNVLKDYKFAARIKSDEVYDIKINKYLKKINLAVQASELSVSLNLAEKQLVLTSLNNEKAVLQLEDDEVIKAGEVDFFADLEEQSNPVVLTDSKLIKSLASFPNVKIKICPSFLIAKLSETHKLMFTLERF